ncbi:phosphotransferase [Parafrankia discariae]|uniref:phosphotransferase n=1 Tax=Parafrankia discariae TaxID=365528 RepID=UPI00037FDBC3|nr:phosphotransferase [Parafrankia discariae]
MSTDAPSQWEDSGLNVDQARQARQHYPDFHPRQTLAVTGKAILLAGTYRGQPAVLKVLTDHARLWRERFSSETATYEAFTATPPPVRTPAMLAPPASGLLLMERLSGQAAARHRYPDTLLSAPATDALLGVATALGSWTAPAAFTPAIDYPQRIIRYGPQGHGVLGADTVAALLRLYERVAAHARWRFAHGDLLPTNVLLTDTDSPAVLDWEYAGLYLPRYDHALLWIILSDDPDLQARIADGPDDDAFWLNVALLLAREIRIHCDEADSHPAIAARLNRLGPFAVEVSREIAARL